VPFFGRKYRSLLLLGRQSEGALWRADVWTEAFEAIDRFARAVREEPSLRVRQIRTRSDGRKPPQEYPWSVEAHAEWCHGKDDPRTARWLLVDAEVFMPPWEHLVDADGLPSVFIQVEPVHDDEERVTRYDQIVLVAVERRLARRSEGAVNELVRSLAALSRSVQLLQMDHRMYQLNAFESILGEQFTYLGCLRDPLPDLEKCHGRWVEVPVPGPAGSGAGAPA
jgi:hypothetical protein